MPEKMTDEDHLNSLAETSAENQKSGSIFGEETSSTVSSQLNRPFGRQKPVHHLLGGGKSADALLWRNKKISASVLAVATAVWVLFEWLYHHFLTFLCFSMVLGMLAQFLWSNWSNASRLLNRPQAKVARLVLPKDAFVNIATALEAEVNHGLQFLQDISCGGNLMQFLIAVVSLWAVAIVGTWCDFLTVIYLGFVAAHTLPVLYESYEDPVHNFVYNLLDQMQNHYRKLDAGLLNKIPREGSKKRSMN